ncbi:MAG TPA: DUF1616 domain-containing protein [Solirubrobacterales bacterium]|nr:DUF1616 domain-containing protein [Solirubrobacterales bacterium]
MRGHRDLRLILALTALCAVGSLITPLGAVRAIFAVPLALVLPGYAIVAAAFGVRLPAWPERVPLTLGISLAAAALTSLVLNYLPGGIHGFSWTLLLVLIVLLACRSAARRRGRLRGRYQPPSLRSLKPTPIAAALGIATLAMVVAALILAQVTFDNGDAAGFTQLWIAPPKPTDASTRIGVTSEQQGTRAYRLVIEVEGQAKPVVENFELKPSHTRVVKVDSGGTPPPAGVEAKLFLRSRPDKVYRRVSTQLR